MRPLLRAHLILQSCRTNIGTQRPNLLTLLPSTLPSACTKKAATKEVALDVASGTALGFRLKKNSKATGFLIKSVDAGGLAEASGQIVPNDYIIAVNGVDVSTVTDIKVIGKEIKSATTTLTLTFKLSAEAIKKGK